MQKEGFIKIINRDIELMHRIDWRASDLPIDEEVAIFRPHHVRKILLDFLNKQYNAEDLHEWGNFMWTQIVLGRLGHLPFSHDDPAISDEKREEMLEYYDDMVSVVHWISAPYICGGDLTEERAREYLAKLDKYENDQYASLWEVSV
jgi:hypothetical protein